MRYLILSDIHSNWHALKAVLEDAAGAYDRILCCGDLVGYGAQPNEVLDWARGHVTAAVRGNHDKACAGSEDLEWFNPVARAAALWTGQQLTKENQEYLQALPQGPRVFGAFQFLHGSPIDEDEYVTTVTDAKQVRPYLDYPLSFFGHTHLQGGFVCHRNGTKHIDKPGAKERHRLIELEDESTYLVNAGSVGQPRDRDPRAAYALYSSEDRRVELRRVKYDVSGAQAAIADAGLPEWLGERLSAGV